MVEFSVARRGRTATTRPLDQATVLPIRLRSIAMQTPPTNATLRTPAALIALAIALFAAPALSAEPDTPRDPLAGPSVSEKKKPLTIIERDADGRVKRLEVTPAEAAAKIMSLSKETREKVDNVLVTQAATMDQVVRDNFDLIVKAAGAFDSKDKVASTRYLQELWQVSEPVRKRGQLVEQIAKVLSKAEADQLRSLVREYLKARLKDEEDAAASKGESFDNIKFNIGETLHALGHEVRRSYERVVGQGANDFEKLLANLNLTPEQDSKVRGRVLDLVQRSGPGATGAQKFRVFMQIINELTPEQRKILGEHLTEQRRLDLAASGAERSKKSPPSNEPKPAAPAAEPTKTP